MVEVRKYYLSPTALIPNSPQPLIHYPALLSKGEPCEPVKIHDIYAQNGWETQWIWRYGKTQTSHYHSKAHECMTVIQGSATVRFGVADTSADLEASTHGDAWEAGGVELEANPGDVFIIPAGVAHKTHDTSPDSELLLLTPGDGHGIHTPDPRQTIADIKLSGFVMMGSYPKGGEWDFAKGGENEGEFDKVWSVPKPQFDPVLGDAKEGLCGLWEEK